MLRLAHRFNKVLNLFSEQEIINSSHRQCLKLQQCRRISALYVTGDKAKKNYMTLQPFLDFENTFNNRDELEQSILHRRMQMNMGTIMEKYAKFKEVKEQLKQNEKARGAIVNKLKELTKKGAPTTELDAIKEEGKKLRNDMKLIKENFHPIEDDFIQSFLHIPNILHSICPNGNKEKILYRSAISPLEQGETHLKRKDLIRFIDNSRYYMLREAAEFDIDCTFAMTSHFVKTGNFIHMANPDFVRRVLLEANATPIESYHLVAEENLQNKINPAYLVGGGAFESFLGAMTKLCVYPNVMPMRMVSSGRSYNKMKMSSNAEHNLFTATQTNAVLTFVATTSAADADVQMEEILNLSVDFYKALNVHFRVVYADASALTPSECLRAVIELYSPAQKCYIPVGHVSNYTDYVSKRILFTMREQNKYHFLHLVGGPVLYTSRLIAILIESGIPMNECKLLGSIKTTTNVADVKNSALNEFKDLFK